MIKYLALVILLGCVTPYQRSGFSGGFTDEKVAEGVYRIRVRGNGYTGLGTLKEYAYRRSHELCNQAGYPHYFIKDSKDDRDRIYTMSQGELDTTDKYSTSVLAVCLTKEETLKRREERKKLRLQLLNE